MSVSKLGIQEKSDLEPWLKTGSTMVERNHTFVKSFLISIAQEITWEAFKNYISHDSYHLNMQPEEGRAPWMGKGLMMIKSKPSKTSEWMGKGLMKSFLI